MTSRFKPISLPVFLSFLFFFAMVARGQVTPKKINNILLQKSIKHVLGTDKTVEWHTIVIPDSTKSSLQEKFKTNIVKADTLFAGIIFLGGEKKYIIPDVAPSRSEMFSYVLYLNINKEIIGVDVLVYRESYGYEIDYPFFREQFKGKQKAGNIIFGRTIQNISGATISARSLTYSIHDLMLLINHISLPQ